MEKQSQVFPIVLNLVAAVIGAFGQYLYKVGANRLREIPLYQNWQIFVGAILFTFVMVLFVISFKLGGKLSVVFPMYATTFLWGSLIGVFLEKEPFHYMQGVGLASVILGVSLIAIYGR